MKPIKGTYIVTRCELVLQAEARSFAFAAGDACSRRKHCTLQNSSLLVVLRMDTGTIHPDCACSGEYQQWSVMTFTLGFLSFVLILSQDTIGMLTSGRSASPISFCRAALLTALPSVKSFSL